MTRPYAVFGTMAALVAATAVVVAFVERGDRAAEDVGRGASRHVDEANAAALEERRSRRWRETDLVARVVGPTESEVEIRNIGSKPLDLRGYRLLPLLSSDAIYLDAEAGAIGGVLEPGAALRVDVASLSLDEGIALVAPDGWIVETLHRRVP